MNFLYEPSLYNISHEDWQEEDKQDVFTEKLLNSLDFLEVHTDFSLLWSEELEELMWATPQNPPWRMDKDFKIKIVPVLYNKFSNKDNVEYINVENSFDSCEFVPSINYDIKYSEAFKNISSKIVEDDIPINLMLGSTQTNRDITNIKCAEPNKDINCCSINYIYEFKNKLNFINKVWPTMLEDKNIFISFINAVIKNEKLNNEFEMNNSFIKDLIKVTDNRFKLKIVEAITKRLTITSTIARGDSCLQEESIKDEIRIRVTQKPTSTRIHFKFDDKKIIFINYYGEGKHDVGL